jgi:hypothetical protein
LLVTFLRKHGIRGPKTWVRGGDAGKIASYTDRN